MRPWGQLDVRHIGTALVTATLLGGGGFIWSMIRPAPKEREDRAVAEALLRRDVEVLKVTSAEHGQILRLLVPQVQRIEDGVTALREERGSGVRPASGKR